jgi:hypothetical protein
VVVAGGFLVVNGSDGVADDVQKRTTNLGMASRWSIASSRGEERRHRHG